MRSANPGTSQHRAVDGEVNADHGGRRRATLALSDRRYAESATAISRLTIKNIDVGRTTYAAKVLMCVARPAILA